MRRVKLERYMAKILFRVRLINGEFSRNLLIVAGWRRGLWNERYRVNNIGVFPEIPGNNPIRRCRKTFSSLMFIIPGIRLHISPLIPAFY